MSMRHKYLLYSGSEAPHPSLDISFMKYLKYKKKYLELQNQHGGEFYNWNDNILEGNIIISSTCFEEHKSDYIDTEYNDIISYN